jgi:hypothetical protein
MYATVGLALFLLRDIRQLGNEADRYLRGSEMEESVAAQLDPLREDGWTIVHNVLRDDGGGNVDHYAAAPGGRPAFAIEAKSGKLRAADRGQAIGAAIWAKGKFGARFVTGVVCVGTDPPERPTLVQHTQRSEVWVVSVKQLREHLRSLA